jgi:2,3,4,5-tetrahydropyridine-2,6-dicarboxylate N-succinyltransferase
MTLELKITEIYTRVTTGGGALGAADVEAIESVIEDLDTGRVRVATRLKDPTAVAGSGNPATWQVNEWVKKAILLYFRSQKMSVIDSGDVKYFDKIPLKNWQGDEGVRAVPGSIARKGSFISKSVVLMPSFVNIGAFVGEGTMVDTWATVGSCAQVGANVHISGGVGLGGVLEPLQASPVIIEDNVFLGSRAIIVEGAVIEEGAVIGAGVTITASTRIIDVTGDEAITHRGRVPANSVVIPGTLPKDFPAGIYGVPCALIIGQRSSHTDKKTSLNNVLRDFNVQV